ncbi:DODA-type extradiol aromatic ring-opening family dioxygenase [Cohnella nanjingensis]|uniref:Dioxygenase n=1 Tax=Cohnella nanjingensis TaxID=1387779 RepID=A0A7X0RX79_9BACL|nr:class III extradiol ring-cleavage dioxygenase [Cohnella nanjingensis]MBB6675333.1 dioxygenase [Cohnella nanjingensis]
MIAPLFLAHGSPMLAIEDNDYSAFLGDLGRTLKPKAIVIFTAHWETDTLTISSTNGVYDTIYDFGGFPDALYQIKYPAKGSVAWAEKVGEKLSASGIPVRYDGARGLDHGSWTLLSRLFPDAEYPVMQVSVNPYLDAAGQIRIGEALRGLAAEDVLIIGSGVTVHNLRIVDFHATDAAPWAIGFDDWIVDKVQTRDFASLARYEELAPNAQAAVPRAEHFVPLLIALGSADPASQAKVLFRGYQFGTLSYLSFSL